MPRYEIRLAAGFADNLMNSVAHCGELSINVERPLRHIYELGAWQLEPVANVLFAPPCLSTLFEKMSPPPDKHLRKDIPSTVGDLFTDSTKIHRITGNSGIIVLGVNNFLHNCRKDLKQRNCFFYRTFFYSISTIFINLRLF